MRMLNIDDDDEEEENELIVFLYSRSPESVLYGCTGSYWAQYTTTHSYIHSLIVCMYVCLQPLSNPWVFKGTEPTRT